MRIAHISDIHWRGIQRHKEYNKAFEELFRQLRELDVDLIINTGDTFHTKTQGITPEIIERLAWMFRSLADIAPTYTILGNHDGNLTNLFRKDIITPIHESINHPKAFLLRKSGVYKVEEIKEFDVYIGAFSPFDQKGWSDVKPVEGAVNIALYHGSVAGSSVDNNWTLPLENCEATVSDFTKFDYAFLGDIHKHQFLAKRKDRNGSDKPWMGYPGSLIQQNFGETETKGYLLWDIRGKDDWDVSFRKLQNFSPFVTIHWEGSVDKTIERIVEDRGDRAFLPGTRFRVSSSFAIPSVEARKLVHDLREIRKANEVTFKYDLVSRMDHVESDSLKISKKGLRQDPDAVVRLYLDYIKAHASNWIFDLDQLNEAESLIKNYMTKLAVREADSLTKSCNWAIKTLEFDNIFRYGEDNKINFTDLEGIVGIFGPNRIGKSSIVGAIMYALYNTTDRGPLKNAHIINRNKNYCKAKVRITVAGTDYIIERQSQRVLPKRNKLKHDPDKTTTTLNFCRVEWDELHGVEKKVSMNSISRDDTDKEIRNLIGTSSDFLLTALSSQGSVDKFIKEGPTERKKILARFLELDIFEKLYALCKEDYNALNSRGSLLSSESIINQITKTRKKISELESNVEVLSERIIKHREQKDDIKLWLMHHEKSAAEVDLAHVDDLEKKIGDFETKLKSKTIELEQLRKAISDGTKQLSLVQSIKKKIDINELNNELDNFEALKQTMNEIKHELQSQQTVLENQKKNVHKLSVVPCGDQFPECHYIRDGHRDKKKIKKQEETVVKLSEQYSNTETMFEEYVAKKIKENIEKYRKLDREEFELSSRLETQRTNRNHVRAQITLTKAEIKKTKKELQKLQKTVDVLEGKEFERKKESLERIRETIHSLEDKRQENLKELGGKQEQLKRLLLEEEETKALIKKLKIYDSIVAAFSKTGIPAMVLKSQLPAINQELSKILEGIVEFKISLETDVSSNVMDVYIQDGHSKRIIELASGMEKTIASLALRVALINLSSLPKSDILIIDEGYGALDPENMQAALVFLQNLKSYFRTIITISHIPEIKECADILIDVENDGLESKIWYPMER